MYKMPELENIGNDFAVFVQQADKTVQNLKRKELNKAVKKQSDIMKFLRKAVSE